jgi:membrane protease YdiL (CAAX protease family)
VRFHRLVLFVVVADAGAWMVSLPLWLSERGLATPIAPALLIAMMATPTLAAWTAARLVPDGRRLRDVFALAPGPFRRWGPYALAAWLGPIAASAAAVVFAAAVGVFHADFRSFSGFEAAVTAGEPLPVPLPVLVALVGLQILLAPFFNAVLALGEELGWRGFLWDTLGAAPVWLRIMITGIVWGSWHAPIILLGYNYPGVAPVAALGFMTIFCILLSALLEWLRSGSGTIWMSALAHGSVNASAGLAVLVSAEGYPVDNTTTGLLGWTGWIVLLVIIAALVVTERLPVRRQD